MSSRFSNYRKMPILFNRTGILLLAFAVLNIGCRLSRPAESGATDSSIPDAENAWIVENYRDLIHVGTTGKTYENAKVNSERVVTVFFLDRSVGWVLTHENRVWKTADAGRTWRIVGQLASNHRGHGRQLFFPNQSDGWAVVLTTVWVTRDGGRSWKDASPSKTDGASPLEPLSLFATANDGECFVGTTSGVIYRTADFGTSWSRRQLPVNDDVRLLFEGKGTLIVASNRGEIYTSQDSGVKWLKAQIPDSLQNIKVSAISASPARGFWAVGETRIAETDLEGSESVLLRSPDGVSWEVARDGIQKEKFSNVRFLDSTEGILLSDHSLYRSTDEGVTWHLITRFN